LRPDRIEKTLSIVVAVLAVAASVAAADLEIDLLAEISLPGDLRIDRTLVGGLSGLTYDPGCDIFYVVSDDRGSIDPPRFFTLKVRFDGKNTDAIVRGATILRDSGGIPFAPGVLDPEALALAQDGTLFLAFEGVPHRGIPPMVARFGLEGTMIDELELPQYFLPNADGTRGVRDNFGFEGLALSPDGTRLFAAVENALAQDGPLTDLDRGSPARLLVFELPGGRPIAEFLYQVGAVPDQPEPPSAFRTNGISEILALDRHRLLVVERSFSAGVGNRVRLYLVDLSKATNISGVEKILDPERPKPVGAHKVLISDLGELGVVPDNIEGMAFGPDLGDGRRLLVLISDNNFQPSAQTNQIVLFAVSGVESPHLARLDARVHQIQGSGHVSPLAGRCVSRVDGLVTAILGSRGGQAFWMQDPGGDGDPDTSEGLFVMTPERLPEVRVGDRIRVGGRVEERGWGLELSVTRLFATELEIKGRGQDLPPPVVIGSGGKVIPQPRIASDGFETYDPTVFAADAFESLEGMLIRVERPVVVGPTSRYGEVVVLPEFGKGARTRTDRHGLRLRRENPNPQRIVIDDRLVTDPPQLQVGDTLEAHVDGIVHYTFGSYKLLNTKPLPPAHRSTIARERTHLAGDAARLTVATFNAESLSSVSTGGKFARLAEIVVENLGGPDILAVQEIQDDSGPEDDGTVSAADTLERLITTIEGAGGPRYESRSIDPVDKADGGQPGANIRTAFLFNPRRVRFADRFECADDNSATANRDLGVSCSPGLVEPGNPAFLAGDDDHGGSRKPLVGEFEFAGEQLFIVNLHLSSKGGDDPIFGRRQPRLENTVRRRTDQAEVVADFVRTLIEVDPSARIVVLGDLNDFENSQPLRVLETAGLEDLVKRVPIEDRYSYVYLGNSQVLDHVLVSDTLADGADVEMVHVNAEFPAADRASDHDPVVVRLSVGR
jgi:endonuclease/exonuclease/phosphatase family metal-dependent hydrolase